MGIGDWGLGSSWRLTTTAVAATIMPTPILLKNYQSSHRHRQK